MESRAKGEIHGCICPRQGCNLLKKGYFPCRSLGGEGGRAMRYPQVGRKRSLGFGEVSHRNSQEGENIARKGEEKSLI